MQQTLLKTPHNLSLKQGILAVMSSTATSNAALMAEAAKQNALGPSKDMPTKIDDEFFKTTSLDVDEEVIEVDEHA